MPYRSIAVAGWVMFSAFCASSTYAQTTCSGANVSDWVNPSKSVTYVVSDASARLTTSGGGDLMSNGDTITIAPDGSAKVTSATVKNLTTAKLEKLGPLNPKVQIQTTNTLNTYSLQLDTPVCSGGTASPTGAVKVPFRAISVGGGDTIQELTLTNVDSLKASTTSTQTACSGANISDWIDPSKSVTYVVSEASSRLTTSGGGDLMSNGDTITIAPDGSAKVTSATVKNLTTATLQKLGPLNPKVQIQTTDTLRTYSLNLDTPVCAGGSASPTGAVKVPFRTASVGGADIIQELTLSRKPL
ncbi:hypothetical protein [Ralstonia sp. 24A2]|uniref:hypothetical protein n=1 Tax=Ralstonia sp. 24A2 TaxID=3447364 RepID=UPI003F69B739